MKTLLAILAFLNATVALAEMRPAQGKPCHATERTLFEQDGKTPMLCEAAGGPLYGFSVYIVDRVLGLDAEKRLIWAGRLAPTQAEIYLPLSPDAKEGGPRLVFKRDLKVDPAGGVIFFGEERLARLVAVKVGSGEREMSLQVPELVQHGWRIPVAPGERVTHTGQLVNSGARYHVVVWRPE